MFKKFAILAAAFSASALLFAITASADTTGYAAGDVINIRQVPAMDAAVVGELYLADPVSVVATEGSWCKIRVDGSLGYVHKDLIVFDRSEVPEPIVVPRNTTSNRSGSSGSSSSYSSSSVPAATSYDGSMGSQIVAYAKNFIGVPYVWGGSTPSGFDCSGFVQYVYRHFGVSLPRTTYSQITVGRSVDRANLMPGDLVFFRSAGHVGIYVGNETYIHAPQTGRTISIDSMANRSLYAARRIF
ncbi:MAG: hypothetical protein E7408_05495 [Ruminococcaceae bacterium]|nr:hypothetical protein [Oscillospiraceae bacterium]